MVLAWPGGLVSGSVVTVNASAVTRVIDDNLYGQNMSVYDSTFLASNTQYVNAVQSMGITNLRIPGGGYGSAVAWDNIEAGANFGSCTAAPWMISMSEMLAFASAVGPGLRFQPIINYKGLWCPASGNISQAVTKAADWVRYLNVTAGGARRADYWEIGNETFYTGDPSYEANGTTYGQNFVLFYNAMKAVDPTIKVGAQCQFDATTWSQNALTAIRGAGVTPDFLIAHAYPVYRATVAEFDNTAVDTEILTTQVNGAAARNTEMNNIVAAAGYTPGSIPYWMTEYRSTVPEGKSIQWVDTLWSLQYLLELARLGWQGANIWAIKNGYSTAMEGDFGLLRSGSANPDDAPQDSPRPAYYIFPYLSKVFGRDLVSASDNGADLRSWAALDGAGDLTVALVNNSISAADNVTINISGFAAQAGTSQGRVWTLQSAGTTKSGASTPILQRRWINVNGTVNPAITALPPAAGAVGQGNALTTGSSFTVSVPAASIVLVRVPKDGAATATPVVSPTRTPTPTASPTAQCTPTLNGMETLAENGTWGGANATRTLVNAAGAPAGAVTQGTYALRAALTTDSAWNNGIANLAGFAPAALGGYTQVKLDVYADASLLAGQGWRSLQLLADCSSCGAGKWTQPIAAADWNLVAGANTVTWNLNFSAGTILPTDPISTLYVVYNHQSAVTGSFYFDNYRLVATGCVAPTPTPTVTPTPYTGPTCVQPLNNMESLTENGTWGGGQSTRSLVPVAGAPAGAVPQGSYAMAVNLTVSAAYNNDLLQNYSFIPTNVAQYDQVRMRVFLPPAFAATSTYHQVLLFADCAACMPAKYYQQIGAAQTLAAGANSVAWPVDLGLGALLPGDPISGLNFVYVSQGSGTGTFYVDQLELYRLGACFTATPTPSATRTRTATASPTRTPSPSASPSRTSSPSPTASPTRTPVADSPTVTRTSSLTGTRSASPTPSSTRTDTRTATPSRTSTTSSTPTGTRSATATASPTPTVTPTFTDVPAGSSPTPTPSISATYTATPTATPSRTASRTATLTGSPSRTPSPTPTQSTSPTGSTSPTPSLTGTLTVNSPTATSSPTVTPGVGSPTVSPTTTPTRSASPTGSPSVTPGVNSPTVTATRSATPSVSATASRTGTPVPGSPTFTPSRTPSSSPTGIAESDTVTVTGTRSATGTPTLTVTSTLTRTATSTVTATPTATPSLTNSPSPAPTATVTPPGPQPLSLSPATGYSDGGDTVTIYGSGFDPGASVTFGGQTLQNLEWLDAGTLRGRVPPGAAGDVEVRVTNPDGRNGSLINGYKYEPALLGPLEIIDARPWPNPSPRYLGVKLSVQADSVTVRCWSRAMVLVGEVTVAGVRGWQQIPVAGLLEGVPNGTYFFTVEAQAGRAKADPVAPLRVFNLR